MSERKAKYTVSTELIVEREFTVGRRLCDIISLYLSDMREAEVCNLLHKGGDLRREKKQ